MADIDRCYMETVDEAFHPEAWYVWQYENEDGTLSPDDKLLETYDFVDRVHTFDFRLFVVGFPGNMNEIRLLGYDS